MTPLMPRRRQRRTNTNGKTYGNGPVRRTSTSMLSVIMSVALLVMMTETTSSNSPFFVNALRFFRQKQKYTPLVYFTLPKGWSPEADALEKVVTKVERDLDVKVQRLDYVRNPQYEALLSGLTNRYQPPVLYNRESMEFLSIPRATPPKPSESDSGSEPSKAPAPHIDVNRVRAWAKGRRWVANKAAMNKLMGSNNAVGNVGIGADGVKVRKPNVVYTEEDKSVDQDELLEDMTRTPLQQKGKQAMKERTERLGQ